MKKVTFFIPDSFDNYLEETLKCMSAIVKIYLVKHKDNFKGYRYTISFGDKEVVSDIINNKRSAIFISVARIKNHYEYKTTI